MPDVLLFDLFGVIARNQSPAAKHTLTTVAEAPAPAFWDAYWRLRAPYDRGEFTGTEYWRQVATALGATFDKERITELITADIAGWNTVDESMIALIRQTAASGTRLALLSNIPEDLANHYELHHGRWLRHFELIAFSCRTGLTKPNPEAFLWCCEQLDVTPEQVLLIDDRAENVYAAEHLGLHGHLFTDPIGADLALANARACRSGEPASGPPYGSITAP
ncbi:HAD family hydrolase [Catellatospora citrea]|nr:HAD family phosphatase [Catellatospora citrea]RKE12000.1 putative hydrolase of the HAD superfamily [Catellatospora citrea]